MKDTHILITNLDQILVNDNIRAFSHALLLSHSQLVPSSDIWVNRIQGYTFDATVPCFDIDLANDSGLSAVKPEVPYGNPEKDTPLLEAARTGRRWIELVWGDQRLRLVKHDPSRGFRVEQFEDVRSVENAISQGVAQYWPYPSMPVRSFVNADQVRERYETAGRVIDLSAF